jgi:hypothetical protein
MPIRRFVVVQIAPVYITQASDWTDVANVSLSAVGLLLTAALVAVAVLEIKRAERAEKAALAARRGRERVAAVRVSAEAYNAHPRLAALLSSFPPDQPVEKQSSGREEQAFAGWAYAVAVSNELSENLNTVLVLAGEASDEVFNTVDVAYTFYRKSKEEAVKCQSAFEQESKAEVVQAHAEAARILLQASADNLKMLINPLLLAQTHPGARQG